MSNKYILFTPYHSGLSNVIMSYEIAFALAHITNRTLILPPTAWILFFNQSGIDKKDWVNVWHLFDKINSDFNTIDFDKVDELKNNPALGSYGNWFDNIAECVDSTYVIEKTAIGDSSFCFVNNASLYKDNADFNEFVAGRKIVDLDRPEKYLYLGDTLFQHYWYILYAGDQSQRNLLKTKVNKLFTFSKKYYDTVNHFMSNQSYNAVHIRRNDFFIQRDADLQTVNTKDKLLAQIEKLFINDKPLYIATDETDKSFFSSVAKRYNILFIEDCVPGLSTIDQAIIDQIICSRADVFIGTFLSTYTKRINIMRGLLGKSAFDYTGINKIVKRSSEMDNPLPWTQTHHKRWEWLYSSHPQWMQE